MPTVTAAVHIPTRIYLGFGVTELLGAELVAAGAKRALIIADWAVDIDLLDSLKNNIASFNVLTSVHRLNSPEITLENIGKLTKLVVGWEAVIATGRGVTLDLVKSAINGGVFLATVPIPPGIGNAITRGTLPPRGFRKVRARSAYPCLALLDPSLTARLDTCSVAASIIETLANSLEAFASRRINFFSLTLAEAALREIASMKLSSGRREGDERLQTYTAAFYAGLANDQIGGAALKALTRAFYALYGLPPYKTLAPLLLPWLKRLCEAPGEHFNKVLHSVFQGPTEKFVEYVEKLLKESSSATTLGDIGIKLKSIDTVVEYAWTYEHHLALNDVTVTDKYSLRELLEAASGK